MDIKISVIIPAYNVEQYLEECLDSVVNQSFRDIEIIAVDDGSTDSCPDILRRYSSNDKRIKVIRQENKGLSGARNTGIKAANGEYLCFVDSDDYLCDDALQIIYDNMQNSDIEVLCFNTIVFYETSEAERKHNLTKYFIREFDYRGIKSGREMFVAMVMNGEYCAPVWMMAIKKAWLLNNSIFFEEGILHEDEKFSLQCYMNAEHMQYIEDKLYVYRIRGGTLATGAATCHRMYSLMVSFQYILKVIGSLECKDDLYHQLTRYAQYIFRKISALNDMIPQAEKLQYEVADPFLDLLFQSMNIGRYDNAFLNKDLYMKGLLQQLEESDKIIIYGAGEIGQLFYRYLTVNQLQDKAIAFAVTKMMRNEDMALPLPICEIDELERQYAGNEATLLIIAGGQRIIGEMLERTEGVGFSNVVLLDEVIKANLRLELSEMEYV